MSFALLPLPHGCSRVSLQRLPCGSASPVTAGIHPQPELLRACGPPPVPYSRANPTAQAQAVRTAGHFLRSFSPAGRRWHPQAARNQPAEAGRLKITPNPRSWGLSPPAMPGQISETRLGAGKKQQKRIDKPTKGRFANTVKNNKKVSKVRRVARGLPAVKKQVRRAIYPPADRPHLKPPRSLAFCPYPPDAGLSFFPFFLLGKCF